MKFYLSDSLTFPGVKGLFTASDIKEGTFLFVDFLKINEGTPRSFETDYRQSEQSKMINSSHNPNTHPVLTDHDRKIMRIASRNIKKGEELTSNDLQIKEMVRTLGYK